MDSLQGLNLIVVRTDTDVYEVAVITLRLGTQEASWEKERKKWIPWAQIEIHKDKLDFSLIYCLLKALAVGILQESTACHEATLSVT